MRELSYILYRNYIDDQSRIQLIVCNIFCWRYQNSPPAAIPVRTSSRSQGLNIMSLKCGVIYTADTEETDIFRNRIVIIGWCDISHLIKRSCFFTKSQKFLDILQHLRYKIREYKRSKDLWDLLDNSSTKITCQFCTDVTLYRVCDNCTELPQNDLEKYKVNATPYMHYKYPQFLNINPFHATASGFLSYRPFGDKCIELLKTMFTTIRSKLPYIGCSRTSKSHILFRLALKLAVSKISANFHFIINHNVKFQSFCFHFFKFFSNFQISKITFMWTV